MSRDTIPCPPPVCSAEFAADVESICERAYLRAGQVKRESERRVRAARKFPNSEV